MRLRSICIRVSSLLYARRWRVSPSHDRSDELILRRIIQYVYVKRDEKICPEYFERTRSLEQNSNVLGKGDVVLIIQICSWDYLYPLQSVFNLWPSFEIINWNRWSLIERRTPRQNLFKSCHLAFSLFHEERWSTILQLANGDRSRSLVNKW